MHSITLDACFKRAIGIELKLRNYYLRTADAFASEPQVRRFFLDLALDEGEHALMDARRGEPLSNALEAKAQDILKKLDRLEGRLASVLQKDYADLNEAFQRMHDIEKTEVDHIFLMLVSGVLGVEKEGTTLRSAMDEHLTKVVDIDRKYPVSERRRILAG
jgi:hypothetical protein